MGIEEILGRYRSDIRRIAAKHGVTRVRVYGNVARGNAGPESEIDFLIHAGAKVSPWFPGGLKADLEQLLGHYVSILDEDDIRPPLPREHILAEAVDL